eukprot:Gregarina_sp_Poly_1__10214@NODE_708_length_6677_cov_81_679879_g535_i0_p3_GENE_NODE_708_length_6677_cov_81_679879_g535_i0NODE_708_length_6677_cov_81_679879_g535_i0_p3_ORF_typecomplete_len484_score41_16Glyco_transf_34/PF05637_12/0_27DUF5010/PF16402_5/0_3_NODE_708_length_6677_cov_81_679879_g535_i02631714
MLNNYSCADRFRVVWWKLRKRRSVPLVIGLVSALVFIATVLRQPAPDIGAVNPLQFEIKVHQGPGLGADFENSRIALTDLTKPVYCRNILLHVVSEGYEEQYEIWIRRQKEWMSNFPDDCFFSVQPRVPLIEYNPIRSWNPQVRKHLHTLDAYRVRYDVQAVVASMGLQRFLSRSPGSQDPNDIPWIYFTDVDTLHMHKEKSIDSLIDRIKAGLLLGRTTETRVCDTSDYFPCREPEQPLPTIDDIAYVVSLDVFCHNNWMYNAGAILWRPSRLLGMIGQSVLQGLNDTSLTHRFDNSDQARIGLVLRDLFELEPDRVRAVCAPFRPDVWKPASEQNEIMFLRRFSITKALTHPVFKHVALYWFPDGRLWPGERSHVAIVSPRWMDSAACSMLKGFAEDRRNLTFFNCGDMTVHFNGCKKFEYRFKSFREQAGATPECREALPFRTNDDNTGPFDYKEWVKEGITRQPEKILLEPDSRYQYGM